MSTLKLAVDAIVHPVRVHKSDDTVVAVVIAVEVQLNVSWGFETVEHSLCCGQMAEE